jgi:hypothetical protein
MNLFNIKKAAGINRQLFTTKYCNNKATKCFNAEQ